MVCMTAPASWTTARERGWKHCMIRPPLSQALVRFWNEANGEQWTGRWCDLHPEFNVAYLWYVYTGIERERLREMGE